MMVICFGMAWNLINNTSVPLSLFGIALSRHVGYTGWHQLCSSPEYGWYWSSLNYMWMQPDSVISISTSLKFAIPLSKLTLPGTVEHSIPQYYGILTTYLLQFMLRRCTRWCSNCDFCFGFKLHPWSLPNSIYWLRYSNYCWFSCHGFCTALGWWSFRQSFSTVFIKLWPLLFSYS